MANICSNKLTITGEEPSLEALLKRLKEQDPALLVIVPNFTICSTSDYCIFDISNIEFEYDDISFPFGSKHACPLDSIATLSTEYPDLTFNVVYEESGTETYGEAYITNGSCNDTSLTELEYLEKHNDNYVIEHTALWEKNYESFVKEYTHGNFFDEHPYSYLDRDVLKRIKDEDLGLFINREWNDSQAASEFKQRLGRGSTEESNS